jgi:hypothetical protein
MKITELEKWIKDTVDWPLVSYEDSNPFIPPIRFGKVVKVHSCDIITIATKLPFYANSAESASIYRFNINLDNITIPTTMSIYSQNDIEKSREELSKLIFGRIVELRNIRPDNSGTLFATVFLDTININDWLIEHKYVIRKKKKSKRRLSESDSLKYISPKHNYNNDSFWKPSILELDTSSGSDSPLTVEDKSSSNKSSLVYFPSIIPNIILTEPSSITQNNTSELILPSITKHSSHEIVHSKQTDCFLSHNWGDNNINHNKVYIINKAIQKRGYTTWFDENEMDGNIRFKMAEGIDNTKIVIVFITKQYRDKVNGLDMKDNCKYEFTYAMNQLGSQNMIPVIMEPEMRDTHKWKGELGAALGSMLFVDISDEHLSENELEKKYDEICKHIYNILNRENHNKDNNATQFHS